MKYQTFRGADGRKALLNVREALGTDALIQYTRHLENGQAGALGRTLGVGGTRAARAGNRKLRHWLRQRIGERIAVKLSLIGKPGRGLVACVGSTGVGKTSTLAKLAERAVLALGRSVIVSLDTFGVGAAEQWRRYAGWLHAPVSSEVPIAYLCNGARAPEDIEDAALDRVLDAIFPEQA